MEYANDCELNVLEICRHVVETIRRKHQTVELDQFGQWNFERIESLELISAGETEINEVKSDFSIKVYYYFILIFFFSSTQF